MKRRVIIIVLALVFCAAIAANAEGATSNLFCYVTDVTANSLQVLTDGEALYSFQLGPETETTTPRGTIQLDDAVVIRYTGNLNVNAEMQSVTVDRVMRLHILYGTVEQVSGDIATVRILGDDGEAGERYQFNLDTADLMVGEDNVVVGDDVEIASATDPAQWTPGEMQDSGYIHITVYGQIEDTFE